MKREPVNKNAQATKDYYNLRESRVGYKAVVHGTKHYGYYPPHLRLSMVQAQRYMESMLGERLAQARGAKVLDAGCGEGYVAIHLAEEFGYEVHGIDLLDWSIAEANKNKGISTASDRLVFKVGDYSFTGYPDDYFDAVYTMETLVHSPDYEKTLREFYRILKPGGVLVNQEYVLADKLPERDEAIWRYMFEGCPMPTFKHFRESRMRTIWEQADFANVRINMLTKNVAPFMKRFYQLAYVPFQVFRLFRKEKRFVNIYAAVWSYRLRHQFRYTVVISQKPKVDAGKRTL